MCVCVSKTRSLISLTIICEVYILCLTFILWLPCVYSTPLKQIWNSMDAIFQRKQLQNSNNALTCICKLVAFESSHEMACMKYFVFNFIGVHQHVSIWAVPHDFILLLLTGSKTSVLLFSVCIYAFLNEWQWMVWPDVFLGICVCQHNVHNYNPSFYNQRVKHDLIISLFIVYF